MSMYDNCRKDIEVRHLGKVLEDARVWSINPLNGTAIVQLTYNGPLVLMSYNPEQYLPFDFIKNGQIEKGKG